MVIIKFEHLTESDKKKILREARNEYMRRWYANRTDEQRERDREKRRRYMREYYHRKKNNNEKRMED